MGEARAAAGGGGGGGRAARAPGGAPGLEGSDPGCHLTEAEVSSAA